jgi:hypothetical protein
MATSLLKTGGGDLGHLWGCTSLKKVQIYLLFYNISDLSILRPYAVVDNILLESGFCSLETKAGRLIKALIHARRNATVVL